MQGASIWVWSLINIHVLASTSVTHIIVERNLNLDMVFMHFTSNGMMVFMIIVDMVFMCFASYRMTVFVIQVKLLLSILMDVLQKLLSKGNILSYQGLI